MLLKLRRIRLDRIKALCATGIALLAQSEVAARDAAVPKPRVDIVDWMHEHVYVPPDSSERPGPLRLTKLQQGIFRSFQEPGVEWVSFQKPPRFGASLGTVAACLYFADHEGTDTFYAERRPHLDPSVENAAAPPQFYSLSVCPMICYLPCRMFLAL